jgi:Leucine-rich repeat (LRR) protein
LPESIGNLTKLRCFSCNCNEIVVLPESIGNLIELREFSCFDNKIIVLPESIGNLIELTDFCCSKNEIISLPESINNLKKLKEFYCGYNKINILPFIGELIQLRRFRCNNNKIIVLPNMENLSQLTDIYCFENKINILSGIENLIELRCIDCKNNKITMIPDIKNLTQLVYFDCSFNEITVIPECIGDLIQLRNFDFRSNQISVLPIQLIQLIQGVDFTELGYGNNPIIYIPEPLQLRLDNLRNYVHHRTLYNDNQNVHDSSIQTSVKKSIFSLLNDKNDISDNDLNQIIIDLSTNGIILCADILIEFINLTEVDIVLGISFKDLLKKVILRIESNKEKLELYKRLDEEMNDAECKCFTGRLSRLVNVLVGYYDDIEVRIADSTQIAVVISIIKLKYGLGNNDELTEEVKDAIRKELTERGYTTDVIEVWLND